MKQHRLAVTVLHRIAAAFLLTVLPTNATRVNPQSNEGAREISNNLGLVFDETIPFPLFDTDAIGGVITINTPGRYYFPENITYRVVIDSDNVCLDMNCRSITRSNASENLITVNSNKEKIIIKNGALYNTAGPGTGCGVLVNSESSSLYLENLKITDCGNGIRLDGSYGNEIEKCSISSVDFVGNTTAAVLQYADKNRFYNCHAVENVQSGYELINSQLNILKNCSVATTNGNSCVSGFTSHSGHGNLFTECVVKNTKTDAWEFCNKSYGFLLTGTEEKTKIIDCIVNETDMTSTVSAVSYGIHLDPILYDYDQLLNLIGSNTDAGAQLLSVAWSPDEKFIVTGDTNGHIRIYSLDYISTISYYDVGAHVWQVGWSPNGKYIATGDLNESLQVFSFDGAAITQKDTVPSLGGTPRVAWSPDGKYIASAASTTIYVFNFDGSNITQVDSISPSTDIPSTTAWSPDGKYIATGDSGNYLRVFSFDGSNITEIDNDNTATNDIRRVAWSPNGKYIVSGDNDDYVRVFSFDGTSISYLDGDNSAGDVVNAVSWSPNGKYISASGYGSFNWISVFSFNGSMLTHIKNSATVLVNSQQSLWSPAGKYIAAVDNNQYLYVFKAMYGPENCLIKNNIVCDTYAYGQFVGTGITGCVGNNGIICNGCSNNEVNYSYGIPNKYNVYNLTTPNLSDNLE